MSDPLKILKKPYKNAVNSQWLTKMLFREVSQHSDSIKPIFTLMERRAGYICARETFIELGDPTGYLWSLKYLGSYQHWEYLVKTSWFKEKYDIWLDELHAKMRGEALMQISDISRNGTSESQRMAACKYLAERPYERDKTSKRGRPSRAERTGHLKELTEADQQTRDDFERVGLKLIK